MCCFYSLLTLLQSSYTLKGQYRHDQQGMESECQFKINSVAKNNTPHDKVILSLLLHKWASNFQS